MNTKINKKYISRKYIIGTSSILIIIVIAFVFEGLIPHLKKIKESTSIQQQRIIPVVVSNPVMRNFEKRITTQGNLEAKNFAMVSSRIPGPIENIFVDEGDAVIRGETKLFEIDSVKLAKALDISKLDIAVAQAALREKQANLERTQVDFNKAELDYNRFKRLFEKEAVTADALEQQQSRYLQLKVLIKHAQTLVDLSTEQLNQARTAFKIAQKDLSDSVIYAPVSGKVSMRFQEPGESAEPGIPVIRIDDTTTIEVSAYLPAQFYAMVNENKTPMRITVSGIDVGSHPVSYKSPTINPKLRTFEVKCLLKNPPDSVVPGAMADIDVILTSRKALALPSTSIQQRAGGTVVFTIHNDIAKMVPVKTGLVNEGWTEILEGNLTKDSSVVTMGQNMLDDASAVSIQQEKE